MQRYISGDILRLAAESLDGFESFHMDGKIVEIICETIKNNMLRIELDIPVSIFIDLDLDPLEMPEMIVVPDFLPGPGNMQIEKAYYQRKISKFFGWDKRPDPILVMIGNPTNHISAINSAMMAADLVNMKMPVCLEESNFDPPGPRNMRMVRDYPIKNLLLTSAELKKKFTDPKLGKPWQKKGRH